MSSIAIFTPLKKSFPSLKEKIAGREYDKEEHLKTLKNIEAYRSNRSISCKNK
jgi:hypothetical protein